MMRRNLLLCSVLLAIILFVATWWMLLLTAFQKKPVHWDYGGSSYTGYIEHFSPSEPYHVRYRLASVFADLIAKTADELYVLKSLDDVCAEISGIDCNGLDSSKIKPLVADALVFRQTREAAQAAASNVSVLTTSAAISFLSLLVSMGALAVSFFTYRIKTKGSDDK